MNTFEPTEEQAEIMQAIKDSIDNPDATNLCISSVGGSGKTRMVCELIAELLEEGYRVAATAMTGKATSVLRAKIWEAIRERKSEFEKGNLLIETVQKITKESKVVGLTSDGETIYSNTWRSPEAFGKKYDVLFVDEMSMIPQYIGDWWVRAKIRVVVTGDHCQLPEVTTRETTRELNSFKQDLKVPELKFKTGYGVKLLRTRCTHALTKILRSTNEIAHLSNDLRDFTMSPSQIVSVIKGWAAKSENITYSTSLKDLETSNDWQIISYTNKMCQAINNHLAIGEDYPSLLDKIILLDNVNPIKAYNGETMLFKDFLGAVQRYNLKKKNPLYVCGKYQGRMPRKDSDNAIERGFFQTFVQFKQLLTKVNRSRLEMLPGIVSGLGYAEGTVKEWSKVIKDIQSKGLDDGATFLQIMEYFEDNYREAGITILENVEPLPRLYMVSFDLGYSITTHKSQGSEFEKVCYLLERFDKPLLYTGVSRAKEQIKIINLTKEI